MGSSHCCDGAIARSVLYMVRYSIKAGNSWGSTDGNTGCFLPHGCRRRTGQGMVAELVDRRSQDNRDRPRDLAGRMADWNAAMPISRSRAVGATQQTCKQQNRTPDLFRGEGRIGVLHRFIKKTQKTPPAEIALAQKRMKEMMK